MSFELHQGSLPLLVSLPHVGTHLPADVRGRFVSRAMDVEDTDWHLGRLYESVQAMGASVIKPEVSRYVIDLNRPSDNTPMYPGAANTELCPTRFFTGEALYQAGEEPDAVEIEHRRVQYWQPYHDALASELGRLRALHGYALLWDGHSIRSRIPWLFDGKLPDLNIGTANGASAHPMIEKAVALVASRQVEMSCVVNGRFKGGYITRHYGNPAKGIHAVQLEKCQCLYMLEVAPFAFDANRALALQPVLVAMIEAAMQAAKQLPQLAS